MLFKLSSLLSICSFVAAKQQLGLYWGQNSGRRQDTQGRLASYCADNAADIFVISFLHVFGNGNDMEANFSNACNDGVPIKGSKLMKCPAIGQDIAVCQAMGKKVLLSLGGANGAYGFESDEQAVQVADAVWNSFGNGTSDARPFGNATVDGFNLDIEMGESTGYNAFSNQLRVHLDANVLGGGKPMALGASPQCPIPDHQLNDALTHAHFDFISVQFYNNYCHMGSDWFNYQGWHEMVESQMVNKKTIIYAGVAANQTAAMTGYVPAEILNQRIKALSSYDSFGGVFVWDASQAYNNQVTEDANFAQYIRDILVENSDKSGVLHPWTVGPRPNASLPIRVSSGVEHPWTVSATSSPSMGYRSVLPHLYAGNSTEE